MSSWLDTETKALLEESPPDKLAPASTARFTLVLISIYRRNHRRLIRALKRVSNEPPRLTADSIVGRVPMTVERGLSHTDALVGQFELISCDAISVFLADGVVSTAPRDYLRDLYASLLGGDEFRETPIQIDAIPGDDRGLEFVDQFLGDPPRSFPVNIDVPFKKARIMKHWGDKIGAKVELESA